MTQQQQQQQVETYVIYTFEVVTMDEYLQDLAYELDTQYDGAVEYLRDNCDF